MGSVVYIHPDELVDIPVPVCARVGDEFEVVQFDTDIPNALAAGALCVILLNPQLIDGLYILEVNDILLLARLFFSGPLKVRVQSLHDHFLSGEYRLNKLKICGQVVELYPTGNPTLRWILYRPGLKYESSDLPIMLKKGLRLEALTRP